MRWNIKRKDPIEKWFAWLPVYLKGDDEIIWLEYIFRYYLEGGFGDGVYVHAKTYEDMVGAIETLEKEVMQMMPTHDKLIEGMAKAFQEATIKPVTWVDAKRGCEAALDALLESLPRITYTVKAVSGVYGGFSSYMHPSETVDNAGELYKQLLEMKK